MTYKIRLNYMKNVDKETKRAARKEYKNLKKKCRNLKSESEALHTNIESWRLISNNDESLKKCFNRCVILTLDRMLDLGDDCNLFADDCPHLLLGADRGGCDKEDCPYKEDNGKYYEKLEEYKKACDEKRAYWKNKMNSLEK